MPNNEPQWWRGYLVRHTPNSDDHCCDDEGYVPHNLVGDLIAEAERRQREKTIEELDMIVREEMDTTEVRTNAEFIACDDLAIRIIKRINRLKDE